MDALLMCGGRGSRLAADVEKPLFEIGGRPMVDRVRDALRASRIETVYPVTSPWASRTREHLDGPVIEAPGDGYVTDLQYAFAQVDPPVLTVAADLPLLAGECVDAVLDAFAGTSLAVYVLTDSKKRIGVSVETTRRIEGASVTPAGVNVVLPGTDEDTFLTDDVRFAVNVNRLADVRIAEALR